MKKSLKFDLGKLKRRFQTITQEKLKDVKHNMETAFDVLTNEGLKEAPSKTGALRNRSNWVNKVEIKGKKVIGTLQVTSKYAVYVHQGTGRFATNGKGRKGWWVYVPGSDVRGKNGRKIYTKGQAVWIANRLKEKGLPARVTEGIRPNPFLRRAIRNKSKEMRRIIAS